MTHIILNASRIIFSKTLIPCRHPVVKVWDTKSSKLINHQESYVCYMDDLDRLKVHVSEIVFLVNYKMTYLQLMICSLDHVYLKISSTMLNYLYFFKYLFLTFMTENKGKKCWYTELLVVICNRLNPKIAYYVDDSTFDTWQAIYICLLIQHFS